MSGKEPSWANMLGGETGWPFKDERPMKPIFAPRADGKPRMSDAQRDTLWRLCGGFNVAFREDDYLRHPDDSSMSPGWVEGWVGGSLTAAGRQTIYVGVSPEGRAHS